MFLVGFAKIVCSF